MWENSMKCLAEVSLQAEPYGQGGGWCCRPPAPRGSRSGSYVGPNELPHNNHLLSAHKMDKDTILDSMATVMASRKCFDGC